MSVDLPQPFGPRMHTCSPAAISRFTSRNAAESPRITVTFFSDSRGGATRLLRSDGRRSVKGYLNRAEPGAKLARSLDLGRWQSKKKEVKTGTSSPPGVDGVLHVKALRRLSRPALPGRS